MVQQIINGGFESSVVKGGQQVSGSNADTTRAWSFSGTSGIHTSASWFNGSGQTLVAPNGGANAGFLFGANGNLRGNGLIAAADVPTITQTFNCTAAGAYTLSFYAAQQGTGSNAQVLHCKLKSSDGRDFWNFPVTPTQGYTQSSFPVSLRKTQYTLSFWLEPPLYIGKRGATSYAGAYVSGMVLVDDVSIA